MTRQFQKRAPKRTYTYPPGSYALCDDGMLCTNRATETVTVTMHTGEGYPTKQFLHLCEECATLLHRSEREPLLSAPDFHPHGAIGTITA